MARKKIIEATIAILVIVAGALGISAAPAFADTTSSTPTCTTDSQGTQTCTTPEQTQVSQATDQSSSTVKATSKGTVTQLVSQHIVFNEKAAQHAGKCFWVSKAYVAGFKNGTGALGWALDHHVHVCKSKTSPTGYIKIGGGITGLDCHNEVKLFNNPPSHILTKVKFVDHMTYKATVKVVSTSTATATVSVSVHNADNSCQASASATASAKGTATATASASANSKVIAVNKAQANMANKLAQNHTQAQTNASATATSNATTDASAKVSCTGTTIQCPPGTTGTPPNCVTPPTNVPPTVNAQAQACVAPGSSNGVVTGTVGNPNKAADTAIITLGTQSITVSVPAGGTANFTLNGFAPGSYSGTAKLQTVNLSTPFSVTVAACTVVKQHTCTAAAGNLQKDEQTITFSVSSDGPMTSVAWSFSDGGTGSGTSVSHTFPPNSSTTSPEAVSGTATVSFSDGAPSVSCSAGENIPAAPPNGNTGPPPPPPAGA